MPITNEQRQAMLDAARPLMQWMNDNLAHPHYKVIVENAHIELLEGVATHGTSQP